MIYNLDIVGQPLIILFMSSLAEIRNNLNQKIRLIEREEAFVTPYKPLVMMDNKYNNISLGSLREYILSVNSA